MSNSVDCIVVSPFFQSSSSSDVSPVDGIKEADISLASIKEEIRSQNLQEYPGDERKSCNPQEFSRNENEPCSSQENPGSQSSQQETALKFSPGYAHRLGKRYSAVKKKPGNVKEEIRSQNPQEYPGDESESCNPQEYLGDESESCNPQEFSRDENEPCSSQENPGYQSSQRETALKFSPRYARRPGKRYSVVKKKPCLVKEVKSPYFSTEMDSPIALKCEEGGRARDRWIPPRSPYALIQEDLFDSPWQLLIATIFLTKTRAQLAIPPLQKFLAKWPTPESLLKADFDEIHGILKPLGLGMLRSRSVVRFTKEFLEKNWEYPIELHGIGKYGNDSYRMFCVNEWRDVTPTDIPLSKYKEWLTINEERLGLK